MNVTGEFLVDCLTATAATVRRVIAKPPQLWTGIVLVEIPRFVVLPVVHLMLPAGLVLPVQEIRSLRTSASSERLSSAPSRRCVHRSPRTRGRRRT